MSRLHIDIIPALRDNYMYLLHHPETKEAVIIDPSEAEPVLEMLEKHQLTLTHIFNTHHHWDHIGGNPILKEKTGALVVGYKEDAHRIPEIDVTLEDGACYTALGEEIRILYVPGHTMGHIVYYIEEEGWVFCGDTLFSMGCGRLFEGTPELMYQSLNKLAALPAETKLYCGHEYTEQNGLFALTLEPQNEAIHARMEEVRALRKQDKPTLPSTIEVECDTNPFFRTDSEELRETLGMQQATDLEVFTEIRTRKDAF